VGLLVEWDVKYSKERKKNSVVCFFFFFFCLWRPHSYGSIKDSYEAARISGTWKKLAASVPFITYRQSFASHSTCSLQHDYYSRVMSFLILSSKHTNNSRSQRPRVRIPLESRMSVFFCVCVT
jgi:hypothetical protein